MITYLKAYIEKMLGGLQYGSCWQVLLDEINRLDPRDFEPGCQTEFLIRKAELLNKPVSPQADTPHSRELLDKLYRLLGGYVGEGSGALRRSFSYITNAGLRKIIERDYAELTLRLFPSRAWKSTVIVAGSILEAILHDVLADPKRVAQTNASPKAPRAKGTPIDIRIDPDDWKLVNLIEVAVDIGVLPIDRAGTIDQVLRDYRNFVHPIKELRVGHECGEVEAGLAKYALDGVCDHLAATL
jgi:hypothetical protein